MSTPARESSTPRPSNDQLARAAKVGSAWAIAQTLAGKIVAFGGQIALSWFLVQSDFGLIAAALSIQALLSFFNPPTMGDALLQRKGTFAVDAPIAFRLGLIIATVSCIAAAASAPVFAWWRQSEGLLALLLILAARPILASLLTVPQTRLRIDLKFGQLARSVVKVSIFTTCLSVVLAAMGWGAKGVVVSTTLMVAWLAIAYSRAAGTLTGGSLSGVPDRRERAKSLFREFTTLCVGQYAHTVSLYADSFVLWLVADDAEVGIYYFAVNLSAQINGAIVYNVSLALQPVFSHLDHDPVTQAKAYLRASSSISSVAIPMCVLQGVLAWPLINLLYPDRWSGSAPVLAILSVAQVFFFAVGSTTAVLKSQSRFGSYVRWQGIQSLVLVPALAIGDGLVAPWLHATFGVTDAKAKCAAFAILLVYAVTCPAGVWIAIRGRGGTLADAIGLFLKPLSACIPGSALVLVMVALSPRTPVADIATIAIGATVFFGLYFILLRMIAPEVAGGVTSALRSIWRRVSGGMSRLLGS